METTKKINILVVDDSAYMRHVLTELLNAEPDIKVIDTAVNGIDALEKIPKIHPDVVILDIEMPRMDGLTTLTKIMSNFPKPVIMFSSYSEKDASVTMKALVSGAFDFVPKPSGTLGLTLNTVKDDLISKIRASVGVGTMKYIKSESKKSTPLETATHLEQNIEVPQVAKPQKTIQKFRTDKIIAIASSTGGPPVLHEIISKLPSNLPSAVLVVQHMPQGFTSSFAKRLDSISKVNVKEACDGDSIESATVLIAPGDFHMEVNQRKKVTLTQEPRMHGVRPAADILMTTIAKVYGSNTTAVVLTGMGKDGASGAIAIKNAGGKTIAQSENTCVVYGMPKILVDSGYADKILSPSEIAEEICMI